MYQVDTRRRSQEISSRNWKVVDQVIESFYEIKIGEALTPLNNKLITFRRGRTERKKREEVIKNVHISRERRQE